MAIATKQANEMSTHAWHNDGQRTDLSVLRRTDLSVRRRTDSSKNLDGRRTAIGRIWTALDGAGRLIIRLVATPVWLN